MKKNVILIGIVIIVLVIIVGILIYNNVNKNGTNTESNTNITASRISTNVNEESAENRIANVLQNKNEILANSLLNEGVESNISKEKEISSYSTTIKDKAEGRLTNINITCSTLNNTIVHNGETFSFNKVVGKPTSERGYKEASIIIDHKTEKGIGGGNCQVSSTLYNAVLNIPSLVVLERHEHGKNVTYVPKGKDAAVSYGSLDLKFRNDIGHDIRIEATTDNQSITVRLIQL